MCLLLEKKYGFVNDEACKKFLCFSQKLKMTALTEYYRSIHLPFNQFIFNASSETHMPRNYVSSQILL